MATRKRPGRKPRDADDSRRRILDAAEAEFAAKGFAGARLLVIAKRAKLKPGLVHFHFGDKAGLYAAVLERAFAGLETQVSGLLAFSAETLPVAADLVAVGEALAIVTERFFRDHGHVLALLRHEAARGSALARKIAAKSLRPVVEMVTDRIESLKRAGILAPDLDGRRTFVLVVSMVAYPILEPLFVETLWPEGLDPAALRADLVAMALARMLAPAAKPRSRDRARPVLGVPEAETGEVEAES